MKRDGFIVIVIWKHAKLVAALFPLGSLSWRENQTLDVA